jgi:hypothetical protein
VPIKEGGIGGREMKVVVGQEELKVSRHRLH